AIAKASCLHVNALLNDPSLRRSARASLHREPGGPPLRTSAQDEIGPRCFAAVRGTLIPQGALPSQRSALSLRRFQSLAEQHVDLVAMHPDPYEHTVGDHDGRHAETAQTIEQIEARVGVAAYVTHVDGRASRLEKRERGLTVGVALNRKEQDLLHRASR